MAASELESFIKEPDESSIAIYVVDFLNTRFTDLEDLGKLNTVLSEVKNNEQKLNEKYIKTQSKTSEILKQSLQAFNSTVTELEDLQATRLELDDILTDYCNSVSSTNPSNLQENFSNNKTLMDELTMLQQQVDSLERSKQYLKVLVVAEELSAQTKNLIERSPHKALNPYIQLANLLHSIKSKSKDAGHVVSHLEVFLQQSVDVLWEDMKDKLKKKFQQSLDALNWPTPIKLPYPQVTTDKLSSFKKAFIELLLLQRPINISGESASTKSSPDQNDELPPLLPIQIMVEPLIVRFCYHFDSKRPTTRIDKPEWYFSHVITTIHEHSPFLQGAIQAIVDEAGFQEYHAKNDFIRCLLVAVTKKLSQSVPTLLKSPQVFSHTVFETLQFDQTLRELHMYVPPGQSEWKGCVEVFTGKKETFKAWLKVEKEFAEARYNEIMHSEDAWELVDEDIPEDDFRPTKSSGKLTNLLELITAELLMAYAQRIDSAVDAFEKSLSYSFVRSVPNSTNSDGKSHTGIEDLKRLCRWLNSAGFVSRTIKEWGEDALWHEVTLRASRNTGTSPLPSPTSSENSDQLQDTSSVNKEVQITVDEGTVFDDPAGSFDSSCEKIQSLIIKNVSKGFFNGLKAYFRKNNWSRSDIYNIDPTIISHQPLYKQAETAASSKDNNVNIEIELSPELYTPLSDLAHSLTFLSNHLPTRVFKSIYKEISKETEDYLWNRVLMRNQFSEMGGRQFEVDMIKGLFTVGKRWVKKPENYFRRLKDACVLLTIPSSHQTTSSAKQNDFAQQKTLSQIMRVLFDNDLEITEIHRTLENLSVYHLSPEEARNVVRRRVECWR
ncbi:3508_t:CDS:10 [Cetraspora pellucida]|uniref:3508_t:CDS:1 n=1 Tax=Cetraspora pellucida TaxID=1433469 RepID=A0A9N9JAF8_9GLOM|nr:3508_t:CDS:10 [Cetraspora pellucida]